MAIRANGQQAVARLIELTKALKRVASGEIERQVNEAAGAQIDAIGKRWLARHKRSGHAEDTWDVEAGKRLRISKVAYLRYQPKFALRGKRLPLSVLKKIAAMYSVRVRAALRNEGEPSDAGSLVDLLASVG